MASYGWNDSCSVGIPAIDAQHKQLFALIAQLHEAMKKGQSKTVLAQVLGELVTYTIKHFSTKKHCLRPRIMTA